MDLKKNTPVIAATVRRQADKIKGKVLGTRQTSKGIWVDIKADDGRQFSTRASLVSPV